MKLESNPLRALRKSMGLTIREWASMLRISMSYVQQTEGGTTLQPVRMLEALESEGLGRPTLAEEYRTWRERHSRSLLQSLGESRC